MHWKKMNPMYFSHARLGAREAGNLEMPISKGTKKSLFLLAKVPKKK